MAKQTFTVGQVLTSSEMTNLQQTAMGGGSTTAKTASYTLVALDAGTVVQMNSASATTITVNTALFAAGDTVQIQNVGSGVCTVTAGTATVSTSATLALKQYDAGSLYFNTTSAAIFFASDAADSTSPLTTKGDLYTYSTVDARLPVGTNKFVLGADSTQSTGLAWQASPQSTLTTTGDILYASAANTPARLGIGTTGQVVTVASGIPSWATPSSGSTISYTSLSSATPSGTTYTVSVASYNYYFIYIDGVTTSSGSGEYWLRFNTDTTAKYGSAGGYVVNAPASMSSSPGAFNAATKFIFMEGGNSSGNDNYAVIRVEGGAGTGAKLVQFTSAPTGTGGDIYIKQGVYTGASAITSISLTEGNGFTFTSGTVRIYASN